MRTVQKGHGMDDTNKLYGLLHGNIPSVNSLQVRKIKKEKNNHSLLSIYPSIHFILFITKKKRVAYLLLKKLQCGVN